MLPVIDAVMLNRCHCW